jgi:hypothetical protein
MTSILAPLRVLRVSALIALLVGATGSLALMLYKGRNAPRFLVVLFAIWVLSPFVILGWAYVASKRWSASSLATLYSTTWIVALGSLAIYGVDALRPRPAQPAFFYVIVAPASWLLMAAAAGIAALVARRRLLRTGTNSY